MAKITVQTHEQVLVYRDGVFESRLEPGRHTVRQVRRTRQERIDRRVRQLSVSGQEIFTADGVTVRVTAIARWQVTDARAFVEKAENPEDLLHVALQLEIRDAVGRHELDELLRPEGRDAVAAALAGAATPQADAAAPALVRTDAPDEGTDAPDHASGARVQGTNAPEHGASAPGGLRATAVEFGITVLDVAVRDLGVVGELRSALAETAIEKQRGRAALERARGEAAALRSLANSAKLLDDHPALATLRLVQAAAESGATVVLTPDGLPSRA
ncbi:slipin family protein [Kribbella lupini]|uniref:Band 7 domain-containing protein n=1 Tax=Kribbella lupini TaxID=291602 RepID=A0ABP4L048_9ACTN